MSEIHSFTEVKKREIFISLIMKRCIDSFTLIRDEVEVEDVFNEYEDDGDKPIIKLDNEELVDSNIKFINQQPLFNKLVRIEI